MAQGDLILKVSDVRGESNDKDAPDWIELTGWAFAAGSTWDPTTGQTQSRVKMGELVVTKLVDISTPILFQFLATNRLIPEVKLVNRKAGGDRQEGYFKIELKDARVRSVVQKGSGAGGTVLEETVSFLYRTITWTHSEQGAHGTLMGGPTSYTYDWHSNIPSNS